jgi:hypothetical protein
MAALFKHPDNVGMTSMAAVVSPAPRLKKHICQLGAA